MTTDELNAIVQAVMTELEKAGVDFDFKAETPQADDLVYVMRGIADNYKGIVVKWQNLLDIIVKKATDAKDEAVSAKDIALQTLATIQGIESNVSSMKSSVDESEANVASMKASVEASESRVTQIKAEAEQTLEEATQTVSGKVSYTDALTYEEIMATNPVPDLTNKVPSASAVKELGEVKTYEVTDVNGGTSRVYKYGKICVLSKMFVGNFGTGNNWRKILTLPDECLPKEDIAFPVVMYGPICIAYGLIYANGDLSVYPTNFADINNSTQYHLLAVWATN